jgi:hypothetical protein
MGRPGTDLIGKSGCLTRPTAKNTPRNASKARQKPDHQCGTPGLSINVTFTPSQFGPRSASIQIADNTVGSPRPVSPGGVGLTAGPNASLLAASLGLAAKQ